MKHPSPALKLLRVLIRKTDDPMVWKANHRTVGRGIFWEAGELADELFKGDVAVEAVNHVRKAIADATGRAEVPAIQDWEREPARSHKEVMAALRRAELRLENGSYARDEDLKLVYRAN